MLAEQKTRVYRKRVLCTRGDIATSCCVKLRHPVRAEHNTQTPPPKKKSSEGASIPHGGMAQCWPRPTWHRRAHWCRWRHASPVRPAEAFCRRLPGAGLRSVQPVQTDQCAVCAAVYRQFAEQSRVARFGLFEAKNDKFGLFISVSLDIF